MDAREAALRFRAGARLTTAFLKKLSADGATAVDPATVADLVAFVGEQKLAPRVLRLVPLEHAKAFFDAALSPWPLDLVRVNPPVSRAREFRHTAARAALAAVFESAEHRARRALDFLLGLFSSEEPDGAWGKKVREAVARFGAARVKDLATRVFAIAEAPMLAAQIAERLVWLAVHSAGSSEAIRALVEDARRDARSGSTRPRAALAVARALRGVDPSLARPELELMKVRIRHRVVLREIEASLAALGEGAEPGLPGVSIDEKGELAFEWKPSKEARHAAEEQLSVQRALLEQQMIQEQTWTLEQWRGRFEGHSLLDGLARRLVWLADGATPVVFTGGAFADFHGRALTPSRLQVAHPIKIRDLDRARELMAELEGEQPFKQVTRETYGVTSAERPQASCLRFMNEVVPEGTLYALSRQRGWSGLFSQQGEGSTSGTKLFSNGWRARLEIHEPRHSLGVCLGELTFETKVKRDVTIHALGEVPPVVFSEACRDLDLVVGVGSVGEDRIDAVLAYMPERRVIVEQALPWLGLGARARIEGRYVRVRGELNEYRVHMGSGQVHALPSGRSIAFPLSAWAPELHLPPDAEIDPRAAVVLQRVLILAGDALVTDSDLASQLAEA